MPGLYAVPHGRHHRQKLSEAAVHAHGTSGCLGNAGGGTICPSSSSWMTQVSLSLSLSLSLLGPSVQTAKKRAGGGKLCELRILHVPMPKTPKTQAPRPTPQTLSPLTPSQTPSPGLSLNLTQNPLPQKALPPQKAKPGR